MINLQTLLSTFDEKGTLLKWLKKVEAALANASLETVQVVVVDATHIKIKFVFADGTSVESPSITLPRGPQGATGPQGPQGATGPQGPQGEAGIVSLESLIALLEGSEFISVDLNEQETKVRIKLDMTNVDNVPTEGSENLVKSGGVFGALVGKLNATKSDVANVGGLVTPTVVPSKRVIASINTSNVQDDIPLNEEEFFISDKGLSLKHKYGLFYLHTVVTSNYTFYFVNHYPNTYDPNNFTQQAFINSIAFNRYIGTSIQNKLYAFDLEIAILKENNELTTYRNSPNFIQKGNAISYFGNDGQEVTILASNFGTYVSDTVKEISLF